MPHMGEHRELAALVKMAYDSVPSKSQFVAALTQHSSVAGRCGAGSEYVRGYLACLARWRPDAEVWQVPLWSSIGSETLQVEDVASMRAFLESEIEKVRSADKPIPQKVLAKMVGVRIDRALREAKRRRGSVLSHRKDVQGCVDKLLKEIAAGTERKSWEGTAEAALATYQETLAGLRDVPVPDVETATRASLTAWSSEVRTACGERSDTRVFVELENFLRRKDVSSETVRAACDAMMVSDVMAS